MVPLDHSHFRRNLPSFIIENHPGSRAVYLMCLVLLIGLLIGLPLIRIRVSVSGHGIIRPMQEKASIIPLTSGMVEKIFVKEGDYVHMSDPILKISSYDANRNLQLLKRELIDTEAYMADLEGLLSDPPAVPAGQKFRSAYWEFCKHLDYLTLMYEKAEREWTRQRGLYEGGLISEKLYDDLSFSKNKALQEKDRYLGARRREWQDQYTEYGERKRLLAKQVQMAEESIRRSMILAPVSGSLEEFSGIFPGSVLNGGEPIGIISPDTRLIGEIYIPSKDIAYLRNHQEVSLLIDAFPSREWGPVKAEIYEISRDYIWMERQVVYRVRCHLPQTRLVLPNGYEGELLKGMTFQARCMIASRSLFQLLTDKADDWLDPTIAGRRKPANHR